MTTSFNSGIENSRRNMNTMFHATFKTCINNSCNQYLTIAMYFKKDSEHQFCSITEQNFLMTTIFGKPHARLRQSNRRIKCPL